MLRKITLYGDLGERFGKEWVLDVHNPHEAAKAIEANKPGFMQYIMDKEYHILVGDSDISDKELMDPLGSKDLAFLPVIHGSKKNGFMMLILGAVLVFAPYLAGLSTMSAGMATAGTVGASFGTTWAVGMNTMFGTALSAGSMFSKFAMNMGMSLMFNGAAAMLAPKPKKPTTNEGPDNGQSYNFDGPVNTQSQGLPIPICYGELIVGGALISASVTSEESSGG
jgi:predicted phage tail protein